ncbi:MAG: phosphoglucosamine mutase [Rickettsiales bacterium]
MTENSRRYFGTDGIRGKAGRFPMDVDAALRIGRATGEYFARRGAKSAVMGKDTRISGYMIESALAAGMLSRGVDVVKLGVLPTPAVSMLTRSLRAGLGVMISASHNPYDDNGIKIFNAAGEKLSDADEAAIETLIDADAATFAPCAVGRREKQRDAAGRYVECVKRLLPETMTLSGMKIALDCANGAAFRIGPSALRELGAEVVKIATSPNGANINADCGSTHPETVAKITRDSGADIGVALDGDADRVIICDETGKIYSGDHVMAALALDMQEKNALPEGALAVTSMSNLGFEEYLASKHIRLFRTDVGDRHVAACMRERGLRLGGEQSGHIILAEHGEGGDGLAAAIRLIAIMKEKNVSASSLLGGFSPYPQLIHNVRFDDGRRPENIRLKHIEQAANAKLDGKGRVILRRSGTEPLVRIMVEGKSDADNAALADALATEIAGA